MSLSHGTDKPGKSWGCAPSFAAFYHGDPLAQFASPPLLGSGASVLVVDDDAAIRDSLRLMLTDEGYDVAQAADGVEALRVLRASQSPLVVLLDIQMPRLSGEDVLREVLRNEHLQRSAVFLVITANRYALTPAFLDLLSRQAIPILEKPLDLDKLLASVAQAQQRLLSPPPPPAG